MLDLFTYKIKPYFSQSIIALFFDDRSGGLSLSLKKTDASRYDPALHPDLNLSSDWIALQETESWDAVFKNKKNKQTFKRIFIEVLVAKATDLLEPNQTLYLNGTYDNG